MLSTWIKAERERRGWSQTELARRIGVRQNTVSQWESGDRTLTDVTIITRLADALGVTVNEVLAAGGITAIPTRADQLTALQARARQFPTVRYVQSTLRQVERHADASDDVWTTLVGVLEDLLQDAEQAAMAQAPEGPGAARLPTRAQTSPETRQAGETPRYAITVPGARRVHEEEGQYYAAEGISY